MMYVLIEVISFQAGRNTLLATMVMNTYNSKWNMIQNLIVMITMMTQDMIAKITMVVRKSSTMRRWKMRSMKSSSKNRRKSNVGGRK